MSREFGTDWKKNDTVRMSGFMVIMNELEKLRSNHGPSRDGRDNFR